MDEIIRLLGAIPEANEVIDKLRKCQENFSDLGKLLRSEGLTYQQIHDNAEVLRVKNLSEVAIDLLGVISRQHKIDVSTSLKRLGYVMSNFPIGDEY